MLKDGSTHNEHAHENPRAKARSVKSNKQMAVALIVVVVVALVIFGGGAYLFTKLFSGASFRNFDESNTMQISSQSYISNLTVDGTIKALSATKVTTDVDGSVSEVNVKDGDEVEKGKTLFVLSNPTLTEAASNALTSYTNWQKQQAEAKVKCASAKSSLSEAKANKAKAKSKTLSEAKSAAAKANKAAAKAAASEDEQDEETSSSSSSSSSTEDETHSASEYYSFDSTPYDQAISSAQSAYDIAKSNLETMEENTQAALSTYEDAQAEVDKLTVKASMAGTVCDLAIEKGMSTVEIEIAGQAMRIVDLSSLAAIVQVPEQNIISVERGQDAVVTSENLLDDDGNLKQVDATVSRVASTPTKASNSPDADVTYYAVRLTLGKGVKKLKEGMAISAEIEVHDYGNAYYVPASAIYNNGGADFVEIVYDDETTKQHEVSVLGQSDDGKVIIQGNSLSEGATIRTDLS